MTIASLLFRRTVTIFQHPYWGSGPFIAKLAVTLATVVWGIVVLFENNPLDPAEFPLYMTMVWVMPAEHWALGACMLGGGGVAYLLLKRAPMPLGACGYFAMMMFWSYLAVSIWTLPLPFKPAQASAVVVIGLLSIYAFLATPRRRKTDAEPTT